MLPERATDLDLDVVSTAGALERLAPEWEDLWARVSDATPFQAPAWLLPWWQNFGRGELLVITFREDGRLRGFLPLYVYEDPPTGVRTVLLVGTGNTDRLDVLVEDGIRSEVMPALVGCLAENTRRWDRCDLLRLSPRSPLLEGATPRGWRDTIGHAEPCPVLTLERPGEASGEAARPAAIPRSYSKKIDYYWRRADRTGTVVVEEVAPGDVPAFFSRLVDLHTARWDERSEPGVLADAHVCRFHEAAMPRLAERGLLRGYGLRLEDRLIACYYGLAAKGSSYYYLSGFDPAYAAFSPGTLVVDHAIRQAVAEGAASFDFLRGREPYKYRWGARDRACFRRTIEHDDA